MVTTESILMDVKEAAAMCGVSRSAWYKLSSCGKVPRPVKIGRLTRWRREELERWIAADCPPRSKWDILDKKK